ELDYSIQLKNGKIKDIMAYGKILRNEQGKAYRIIGANLDISQSKQNQRDLQKSVRELKNFRQALDTSALIISMDTEGKIKEANKAFCKLSGYTVQELIDQELDIVKSSHHPPAFFADLWKYIRNGNYWKGEVKNKARDGSFYWTDMVIYPIQNDKGLVIEYLAIGHLITKRKQAEEERIKLLKDLEEFAFATSHSLRKPVANIMGLVGIFDSENLGSSANAFIIESLKIASGEMDAVIREMNDILMRNYDQTGSE
ncbi:MAG: PAS domain S-box protein, partial [Bacteroidota bacterium]